MRSKTKNITIDLNGKWKLWFFQQDSSPIKSPSDLVKFSPINAIVPGNVELDLVRAGILPKNLYFGENLRLIRKYEYFEWWYQKKILLPPDFLETKLEIIFYGVDCFAEYWWDDAKLGDSKNMFIEHKFCISEEYARTPEHYITVRIRSSILESIKYDFSPRQSRSWGVFKAESLRVRKAPHSYGWDIMPRAISAGIWRKVEIRKKSEDIFKDFYIYTIEANTEKATIAIHYVLNEHLAYLPSLSLDILGECKKSSFKIKQDIYSYAGTIKITIKNPKLWWPRGYGIPNLYRVKCKLTCNNKAIGTCETKLGIRTVSLDCAPGKFLFKINQQRILIKGANWVPVDVFHSRDIKRIHKIIKLYLESNCNLIRCWGGNVYEDHNFFDFCDEAGLMVWQDFAMACGLYPQDQEFIRDISIEIKAIVKKLRSHPSLILWCGDNECDENAYEAGIDPNNNLITREVIPGILHEEDPVRPYLPSSPFYLPEIIQKKDISLLPERHLWGPRDFYKSSYYLENRAPFISEIGFHGCPDIDSIRKFIDEKYIWPCCNNKQWIFHASDPIGPEGPYAYRIDLMMKQVYSFFGFEPDNIEDFVLASQIVQAESLKYFIEKTRIEKWDRTGIIWWNMSDGWPQFSDAVVDYYGRKKLAFYYIKRVQRQLCLMAYEMENAEIQVVACNDSFSFQRGNFFVKDFLEKKILLKGEYFVSPNENTVLGKINPLSGKENFILIEWENNGLLYGNHALIGQPPFLFSKYKEYLSMIRMIDKKFPFKIKKNKKNIYEN